MAGGSWLIVHGGASLLALTASSLIPLKQASSPLVRIRMNLLQFFLLYFQCSYECAPTNVIDEEFLGMAKFHFTYLSLNGNRVGESFGDHDISTRPSNDLVWRLLWREESGDCSGERLCGQ